MFLRVDFQCRVIFTCVRTYTYVKFTFANRIEAMHEWSLVRVKVVPRSTSRLSSALFILPLLYLRDQNLRALTCVVKNTSVEINPKWNMILNCLMKHRRADMTIILTDETLVFVLHLYHFSVFGYQMKHSFYRCPTPYIG